MEEGNTGADAVGEEITRSSSRKVVVRTLESGKSRQEGVVEDIIRLERRIFPKHESLAENLDKELQKRNVGVLYSLEDDFCAENCSHSNETETQAPNPKTKAVAGYAMYTCTSLAASITKLAVRESCRRQGYGEALVKAVVEKARSKRVLCVNLHVDPLRAPALNLYRKLGFEIDALVHSYYAPNRDAYRMVLTFASV